MVQHGEDELLFLDESDGVDRSTCEASWRVLIVDDEPEVHSTTVFALGRIHVLGRGIEFLHAYSAAEARHILESEQDIAAIFLDVVMEQENAGLTLVHEIRNTLQLHDVRIILRTGQSGHAPEVEAIRDYDINDYKNKSELTRTKLFTTLTSAIRSYDQLRTLGASRRGLEVIVRGSAELIALRSLDTFAAGVIVQLSRLLGQIPEGLVCLWHHEPLSDSSTDGLVLAAAGVFSEFAGRPLATLEDPVIRGVLSRCLGQRKSILDGPHAAILVGSGNGRLVATYLPLRRELSTLDKSLLDVFCTNISVCVDNLGLFERLQSFAYFDQMLNLPNRTRLIMELDQIIASGDFGDIVLALIDIDHFAETNDALGHPYGDLLLQAVASRLAGLGHEVAIVARVSGDTFGVLGRNDVVSPEKFKALFKPAFLVDGNQQAVSSTMGFVRLTDVEGSGAGALKNASIALKRAKSGDRGGFAFYERSMGAKIRERVLLLHDLRSAFESNQLFLHYQPQVDLQSGRVIGAEALIRWKTEAGIFVPPERFIHLAEYSGLIVGIGEWVLRTACQEQMRLEREGFSGFRMAVNVTAVQFRHPEYLAVLDAAIADTGVSPQNLELEITESVAMLETSNMVSLLNEIKKRGVTVAIDDFGTGFSSLSYLQQLNVDRLKIDRTFVNQMNKPTIGGQSIAQMVIDLGRNLGLVVIAEGVENAPQAARLLELGCHEAQGYYFARPMQDTNLSSWLADHPMPM